MNKLVCIMNKGLAAFCIGLSGFLVVCVVWQVVSRYILNDPSTTTDEIARFLFIWVGLMGAAYTVGQKRHLAIDLADQLLEHNRIKRTILRMIVSLISLVFSGVIMIYGGSQLMLHILNTGQISPALGIQMGWVYSAIPLCGLFMLVYMIVDFVENIQLWRHPACHSVSANDL